MMAPSSLLTPSLRMAMTFWAGVASIGAPFWVEGALFPGLYPQGGLPEVDVPLFLAHNLLQHEAGGGIPQLSSQLDVPFIDLDSIALTSQVIPDHLLQVAALLYRGYLGGGLPAQGYDPLGKGLQVLHLVPGDLLLELNDGRALHPLGHIVVPEVLDDGPQLQAHILVQGS